MNRKIFGYICTSVLALLMCFEIIFSSISPVSAASSTYTQTFDIWYEYPDGMYYYERFIVECPNGTMPVAFMNYQTPNSQYPNALSWGLCLLDTSTNKVVYDSNNISGSCHYTYWSGSSTISMKDALDKCEEYFTTINPTHSLDRTGSYSQIRSYYYLNYSFGSTIFNYSIPNKPSNQSLYAYINSLSELPKPNNPPINFDDSVMNTGSSFVGIGYQQTTSKYSFSTNKVVTDSKTMFNSAQIAFRDNLGNVVTDPLTSGLYKRVLGSWEDDPDNERWILSIWYEKSDGTLIPSVDFEMYGTRGNSVNIGVGTVSNDWSITSKNNYVVIPYSMGGTKITSSTFTIYTSSQDDVTGDSGYVPDLNDNGSTDNIISGGGNNSPTYILDGSNFDVAQFLNGQYMQGFIGILSSFFGFLPAWLWVLLGFSITAFTVMAIYKFIKG